MSTPPINPYAPSAYGETLPTADSSAAAQQHQMYSVAAITLAGFLGAVVSAAVLIALNF